MKMVVSFLILLVIALPAFAGEGVEQPKENRIILATADDTCRRECSMDRSACETECSRGVRQGRGGSREILECKDGCRRSNDRCLDRCR